MSFCIQIGNSDDKLTQKEWSAFVRDIHHAINGLAIEIHFQGTSDGHSQWQNACWVADFRITDIENLESKLRRIRHQYRQDSIAIISGEARFI